MWHRSIVSPHLLCTANAEDVVLSARNRATNGSDPYPGAEAPRWVAALPLCGSPRLCGLRVSSFRFNAECAKTRRAAEGDNRTSVGTGLVTPSNGMPKSAGEGAPHPACVPNRPAHRVPNKSSRIHDKSTMNCAEGCRWLPAKDLVTLRRSIGRRLKPITSL